MIYATSVSPTVTAFKILLGKKRGSKVNDHMMSPITGIKQMAEIC
jgi:hypothetical protein